MGTRGLIIIVYDGRFIVLYNRYDSDPTKLGRKLVMEMKELLEKHTIIEIKELLNNIKHISGCNNDILPTEDEKEKLKIFSENTNKHNTWLDLLRKCEGSILKIIESGYAIIQDDIKNIENHGYMQIEYEYQLNLDEDLLLCNNVFICRLSNVVNENDLLFCL